MLSYQYAYLLGNLFIGGPIWLFVYAIRKDLRHKILVSSLVGAILGPLSEVWYTRDYWQPLLFNGWRIGFEDMLFGFLACGVGSVVYEEIFGIRYAKRHTRTHHWQLLMFPSIVVALFTFDFIFPQFYINSIYASFLAFAVMAIIMIKSRHDLLRDALTSGILFSTVFFFCYMVLLIFFPDIFHRMWFLKNISGISLHTVPVEELLWAFGFGMMIGPMYEFYAGIRFQQTKKGVRRKKR